MPKITFVAIDGTEYPVEAANGDNLMTVAVDNSVPGIDGDCGGNCACATCHIYVDDPTAGEANDEEKDMLSIADDLQDNSRLGCQITVSDSLDGLVVKLPAGQH